MSRAVFERSVIGRPGRLERQLLSFAKILYGSGMVVLPTRNHSLPELSALVRMSQATTPWDFVRRKHGSPTDL